MTNFPFFISHFPFLIWAGDSSLTKQTRNPIVDITPDLWVTIRIGRPHQQAKVQRVLTKFQKLNVWRRFPEHPLNTICRIKQCPGNKIDV